MRGKALAVRAWQIRRPEPVKVPRDSSMIRRFLATVASLLVLISVFGCAEEDTLPWQDDFSSPESGWQAESDASAEVRYADGAMQIRVMWPDKLSWASADRDLSDIRLTVEASQVTGPDDNEYGVLTRMQDGRHFYMFAVSGDGYYRVVKRDGDEETLLTDDWTLTDAINRGTATNHLGVTCDGGRLAMTINGVVVAEVMDDTYAHGDIALYAGTFRDPGQGVEIHFDNLDVDRP
jgi:hypothetical protein